MALPRPWNSTVILSAGENIGPCIIISVPPAKEAPLMPLLVKSKRLIDYNFPVEAIGKLVRVLLLLCAFTLMSA